MSDDMYTPAPNRSRPNSVPDTALGNPARHAAHCAGGRGVEPPDISAILTSIVVQLFGLFITHLGDVLYSEVVMRRPMLLVVHRNFRGYDLFLCLLIFTMWAETSHGILGSTLGRVPRVDTTGDREPTWLFLTEDSNRGCRVCVERECHLR
jgi:hypothetical protein